MICLLLGAFDFPASLAESTSKRGPMCLLLPAQQVIFTRKGPPRFDDRTSPACQVTADQASITLDWVEKTVESPAAVLFCTKRGRYILCISQVGDGRRKMTCLPWPKDPLV